MAYSSGFNPHPRISYVNPAPTGVESEAEYLIIALRETCIPADVRIKLAAVMPEDFPIIAAHEVDPSQSWDASLWEIHLDGISEEVLTQAASIFMEADEILVSREVKTGLRTFDARGSVESLKPVDRSTLKVVIRHTEPLVRPADVVGALTLQNPPEPRIKRIRQGSPTDLLT
jgi:radical SAM-linked protein